MFQVSQSFLLRADLHGTTLSHTTSLRQVCDKTQDLHNNCERVVGLIYKKQFVLQACGKLVICDKVVPCKSAFTMIALISGQHSPCNTKTGLSCAEGSESFMQFNGSHRQGTGDFFKFIFVQYSLLYMLLVVVSLFSR